MLVFSSYSPFLDFVSDICSPGQISKIVLPLTYKMLDDTRSEVKVKTEKLVKKLHFLVGSQVVDMCPQNKLQRVQDIIFRPGETGGASSSGGAGNTSNSLAAGGGTFGAVGAANLILQNQSTRGSRLD
jgi:uncharacterized membrane protein YgcG